MRKQIHNQLKFTCDKCREKGSLQASNELTIKGDDPFDIPFQKHLRGVYMKPRAYLKCSRCICETLMENGTLQEEINGIHKLSQALQNF